MKKKKNLSLGKNVKPKKCPSCYYVYASWLVVCPLCNVVDFGLFKEIKA